MRSAAASLLALLVAVQAGPVAALTASPDVVFRTIAGSGAAGFADGTPGSFVMPFGVAYGPDGTLYVSDAGAQRIRAVDANGRVRTIAGGGNFVPDGLWVTGGYRDGKGAEARFNRPAGIVWLRGKLYVADTGNHCIREVDPDGTVRTFAGTNESGAVDGPVATARFFKPTGLATDREGDLYVADFFGIRVIHDGVVHTIQNMTQTPFGVAVADSPQGPYVFAADLLGLVRRSPDGAVERFANTESIRFTTRNMQGIEPLGYPFSLAAFDDSSVVYGDVRDNAIRYLNWEAGAEQVLGGVDVFDGAASTAGYRDGAGDVSRFDGPTGLAIAPNGDVAIADAQNRRIRVLTKFDRSRDAHQATIPIVTPASPSLYRVAFVGNSYLWNYDRWSDSILSRVGRRLATDPGLRAAHKHVEIAPYVFPGSPFSAQAQWIQNILGETHAADLIVMEIATSTLYGTAGLSASPTGAEVIADAPAWSKVVTDSLRATNEELRKDGIRLIVVTSPVPENISPSELLWRRLISPTDPQADPTSVIGEEINAAVRTAGVPFFDEWAVFDAESRSANHVALFGTEDEHFSQHGRDVYADALAAYLAQVKPWALPPPETAGKRVKGTPP
ncbi:MAG TPA: hypothetical protein VFB22_16520 [Candidatus Baltobacteraceae bacterium]|nr:hypothetical protein [Candidatus Baltobacteraceae bacterium]